MISDEMVKAGSEALAKRNDSRHPEAFEGIARAVLEAALPTAEPVFAVLEFAKGTPGRENEMPLVLSCNWLPDGRYNVFLNPPAPSVSVRGLEWVEETQYLEVWRARPDCGLVFTVEDDGFSASKYRTSVGQKVIGYFTSLIKAQAAAQTDYEARIRSALCAAGHVRCEGCDGYNCDDGCAYPEPASKPAPFVAVNAEDLARQIWGYFKGDSTGGTGAMQWFDNNKSLGGPAHVIALCRSALSAQVQEVAGDEEWQIVPKHPTGSMIEAVVSMVDDDAPHLFLLNLYRAMLAAAPAKQED
ncbi:hypothetical protein [Rhizobium sp. Root651]|uniref:hypothetical protein n=1 Tax=Rhizobium sp. Root651 TaxID=1736577 RepID=UPI000712A1B1|nr:hypothetical protein [Rhizobium sp. Root651]KRA63072.1 hypothetical protein ASD85_06365 [Rhizobium sp. Root651]